MMFKSLACLVVGLAMTGVAYADLAADLSASQLQQLKSGQMIVIPKDVPGGAWPQVTVYTLVNAPVPVIAGVFRDYKHASEFQPDIISAKVVSQPSPDVCDVEYTQKMPILGTTTFTVRNTFSQTSDGGETVQWKLLKSPMAEVSDGSLRVEPFEKGSILRYVNYVKPKIPFASVAKSAALDSVKSTVSQLKAEAEKRAKSS
jgi:hypothetical protein